MFRIDSTQASGLNEEIDAPGECASCGISSLEVWQRRQMTKNTDISLKRCTACYSVRYCGVTCQKKHRKQHREECKENADKRRAFNNQLFEKELCTEITPLPPRPDCDICMHIMPLDVSKSKYYGCCGKMVCLACSMRSGVDRFSMCEDMMENARVGMARYGGLFGFFNGQDPMDMVRKLEAEAQKVDTCPFCRSPDSILPVWRTKKHFIRREQCLESRVDKGDSRAALELAWAHARGESAAALSNFNDDDEIEDDAFEGSHAKALEYLKKAASMGNARAYEELSTLHRADYNADDYLFCLNQAVELGNAQARNELAILATEKKQFKVAMEHYKVLASAGYGEDVISKLTTGYKEGYVKKAELKSAIRDYHAAKKEVSSKDRSNADRRVDLMPSADGKRGALGMPRL